MPPKGKHGFELPAKKTPAGYIAPVLPPHAFKPNVPLEQVGQPGHLDDYENTSGMANQISEAQAKAAAAAQAAALRAAAIRQGVARNTAAIQAAAASRVAAAKGTSAGGMGSYGDWNPALKAATEARANVETLTGQKTGGRAELVKKNGKWVYNAKAAFTNRLERVATSPLTDALTQTKLGIGTPVNSTDDISTLLAQGSGTAQADAQAQATGAQRQLDRNVALAPAAKRARKELTSYLKGVQKQALADGKKGEAARTQDLINQVKRAPNARGKGGLSNVQVMALAYGSKNADEQIAGKRGILGQVAQGEQRVAFGAADSYSDLWSLQNFNPLPLVRAVASQGFQVGQYLPGGNILSGLGVTPSGIAGEQRPSLLVTGLMAPFQASLTALSDALMLGANAGWNLGYAGDPFGEKHDLADGPGGMRQLDQGMENPLDVYARGSAGLTPGQVLQKFHKYTGDSPGFVKSITGKGGSANIVYDFVASNVDPLSFALVGLGEAAKAGRNVSSRAGRAGLETGARDIAERTGVKVPTGLVGKDGGVDLAKLTQLQDAVAKSPAGLGIPRALSDYAVQRSMVASAAQARGVWIQGSVGVAILDDIAAKAVKAPDVASLRKLLGNETSAEAVFALHDAARKGGVDAARELANKLIQQGALAPQVSVVNQLALKVLGSSGKVPGIGLELARPSAGLWGGKVTTGIADTLDRWARGKAPLAVIESHTAHEAGINALDLAARVSGKGIDELVVSLRSSLEDVADNIVPRMQALDALAERIGTPAYHGMLDNLHGLVADGVTGDALWREMQLVETVGGMLDGAAGDAAKRVAADSIERMWVGSTSGRPLLSSIREAANRVSEFTPNAEVWEPDLYKGVTHGDIAPVIGSLPDSPLKQKLIDTLQDASTAEQLRHLAAAADLAANPTTRAIAERLFGGSADREAARGLAQALVEASPKTGKLRQAIGRAGLALKGGQESIPFKEFRYGVTASGEVNVERMIQHVDQLARAVHLDPISRAQLVDRVRLMAASGPKQAFEVVRSVVRQRFIEMGGGKLGVGMMEMADEWFDDFMKVGLTKGGGKTTLFGITFDAETGQIIKHTDHPMALSQEVAVLKSPTQAEVAEGVREMLASAGGKWAKIRVAITDSAIHIGETTIPIVGSLKAFAAKVHQWWKVMVVTRLWAPFMVGATVLSYGISHEDDMDTVLKNTAIGFAAGGLGASARFFMRVQLQDKLTALMTHGMYHEDAIPGVSRMLSLTGQIDNSFNTTNFLVPQMAESSALKRRWWQTPGEWEAVELTTSKKSLNAWERIVNKVVNPESDTVMEILLHARAGLIDDAEAQAVIKQFLATKDGKQWSIRAKYAGVTVESTKELADSLPAQIARLRVDGAVGLDMLEAAVKEGIDGLPTHIPTQQLKGLASPKTWWREYKALSAKATNVASTKGGVRTSWFNAELHQNERRLLAFGYEPTAAKEAAASIAKRKMDEFFQFEQFSRFSAKADWVMPFMGPQQFDLKTWFRLSVENPGRVVRFAKTAGLAFNAGSELGVFTQDPSTGQWMLSVPGSGWLSRHLFGGFGTDMPLTSFFAMTSGGFGIDGGMMPQFGGPWFDGASRALFSVAPELFDPQSDSRIPDGLRQYLTPFAGQGGKPSTGFVPRQITLMTMALTGGQSPPWEFLNGEEQESEYNKWFNSVTRDLITEHRTKHPADLDWFPSKDEIQGRLTGFFTAWSTVSSFIPSSLKPTSIGKSTFETVKNIYTMNGLLDFDMADFNKRFPQLSAYTMAGTTPLDDSSLREWETDFTHNPKEYLSVRRQLTPKEFKQQFEQARRTANIWDEYREAQQIKGSIPRELAMEQWRDKYPEMKQYFRNKYLRDQEFFYIQTQYPHGAERERALNRWRHQYADEGKTSVSFSKMRALEAQFRNGSLTFQYSPWKLARSPEEVAKVVERQVGGIKFNGTKTISAPELAAVKGLSPNEQLNYWKHRKAELELNALFISPEESVALWKAIGTQYSGEVKNVYTAYPWLNHVYPQSQWEGMVADIHTNERDQITAIYAEINNLNAAVDEMKNPEGSQYKYKKGTTQARQALYSKRTELYAAIKSVKDANYKHFPEFGAAMEDLQSIMVYAASGADVTELTRRLLQETTHLKWIPTNDEIHWQSLPHNVRKQEQQAMANKLTLPAMELRADGTIGAPKGKMLWEWLTVQQQEMLTRLYPHDVVEGWKAVTKEVQDNMYTSLKAQYPQAGGSHGYSKYYRRGGYGTDQDELSYAFSLMKEYDRRGGMAKPPAYAEYLALPKSPGVRNEFLKNHPDVVEYIKAGPFANMPPLYQAIVSNIMIKHGKWEGEVETPEAITDLAFAREQLARWNRRGNGTKPSTYDVWLNMPTGVEKARYIQNHPEIRAWIQAGPMANMPDAYQEVVRDIMQRYGEWSAQTDPLGEVLNGYYNTPAYAKDQYLAAHPEIQAYWNAIRSPAEQASRDLVDQYYAIPDNQARRAFVASHPELQQYFLDARNKRYEQFADKVAQFLGQNPDYFERYLQEQTTILRELMQRFGTAPLIREGYKTGPPSSKGRKRD